MYYSDFAIERLKQSLYSLGIQGVIAHETEEVISQLQRELAETKAKVSDWISVEDMLPEDDDHLVLVLASGAPNEACAIDEAYELATYSQDDGWILEEFPDWETPEITYWMPLPGPPEEDDSDD